MKDTKNVIGGRIGSLLSEKNKRQKELAEYLGVTANTVSYYVTGTRVPNIDQIIKIAEYFNVSTDYLLGTANVSTTDMDLKEICKYLSLSEQSIQEITQVTTKNKAMLDSALESGYIRTLIKQLNKKQLLIENILKYMRDNRESIIQQTNTKPPVFDTRCIEAEQTRNVDRLEIVIDKLVESSKDDHVLTNELNLDEIEVWFFDLEHLGFIMARDFDHAIETIIAKEHRKSKGAELHGNDPETK